MGKTLAWFIKQFRRFKSHRYGWHGNYSSWEQALQHCTGYNAANILEKVRKATLKVKNGEAAFEKDSILFDTIEYSWPLLSTVQQIAIQHNNKLSVIDFGGSLGSSYFQHKKYLGQLEEVKWSVVEQHDFVTVGQKEIADGNLQFFYSIDEAMQSRGAHHVLIVSCVLPYLEQPYAFLRDIAEKGFQYIIIENTYFNPGKGDRLTVQNVSPVFYEASYPAWFLDYEKVKETLNKYYDIDQEYINTESIYLDGEKVLYRGFVMKIKPGK